MARCPISFATEGTITCASWQESSDGHVMSRLLTRLKFEVFATTQDEDRPVALFASRGTFVYFDAIVVED